MDEQRDPAGAIGTAWNYSGALWSLAIQNPVSLTVWIVGIALTLARDWYRYRAQESIRDHQIQELRDENQRLLAAIQDLKGTRSP